MKLQEQIEEARATIKTDSYSMSIGEWISIYDSGELEIHPEFQRFFRWSNFQKSRFIESLLLGIPIPPIFVAQTDKGIWDVVDGLQRLSTLFEFVGVLKDEENKLIPPLTLEKTKYLPSLEGKKWEDIEDSKNSFTQAQRLDIKRSKFDVSIILRESDEVAKFELFQRLNTGGSPLSDQEVRNCIIIMINKEFYFWLRNLSQDINFLDCIGITEKAISEQYDIELALRFLIFRKMVPKNLSKIKDVGEFLTDEMVTLINNRDFNIIEEERIFRSTYDLIARTLGSNAFRRYNPEKEKHFGGFLLSAFEVVALGIGYRDGEINKTDNDFIDIVKKLWNKKAFKDWSGSGVRASSRIPKLVPLGRKMFK